MQDCREIKNIFSLHQRTSISMFDWHADDGHRNTPQCMAWMHPSQSQILKWLKAPMQTLKMPEHIFFRWIARQTSSIGAHEETSIPSPKGEWEIFDQRLSSRRGSSINSRICKLQFIDLHHHIPRILHSSHLTKFLHYRLHTPPQQNELEKTETPTKSCRDNNFKLDLFPSSLWTFFKNPKPEFREFGLWATAESTEEQQSFHHWDVLAELPGG